MVHALRRSRLNRVNVYRLYDTYDIIVDSFDKRVLILFTRNRKEGVSQCRKMERVEIIF